MTEINMQNVPPAAELVTGGGNRLFQKVRKIAVMPTGPALQAGTIILYALMPVAGNNW
jgi:hypothetical protein